MLRTFYAEIRGIPRNTNTKAATSSGEEEKRPKNSLYHDLLSKITEIADISGIWRDIPWPAPKAAGVDESRRGERQREINTGEKIAT